MAGLFGGAVMYIKAASRKGRVIASFAVLAGLQFVGTFAFPPPTSDRLSAITGWWREGKSPDELQPGQNCEGGDDSSFAGGRLYIHHGAPEQPCHPQTERRPTVISQSQPALEHA